MLRMLKEYAGSDRKQKGQIIILAAVAFLGIIAIVGLVIDGGNMFIQDGRLRRAIDAAAISAALQYRADASIGEMQAEATQFLLANGIQPTDLKIVICDYSLDPLDPANEISPGVSICTSPVPRKRVYVYAAEDVKLAFLPIIGLDTVNISSSATSEAASVDVVLAMDRSESMTFSVPMGDPSGLRDPYYCNGVTSPENNAGDCEPFNTIKNDAMYFVTKLYSGFDRVAIVTFDKHAHVDLPLNFDLNGTVHNELTNLSVYYANDADNGDNFQSSQKGNICNVTGGNPCRWYLNDNPNDAPSYQYFKCPQYQSGGQTIGNCTTTNIGEGLGVAVNQFISPNASGGERDDAVWVIILLTDGATNAAYDPSTGLPYCPTQYWSNATCWKIDPSPFPADPTRVNVATDPANYNPYDYVLDAADTINADGKIIVFTIGVGPILNGNAQAKALLQYIADQDRGNWYIAPTAAGLHDIFVAIANNIATKLSQ